MTENGITPCCPGIASSAAARMLVFALALAFACSAVPSAALNARAAPDLLVLVLSIPGQPDRVSFTYKGVVDHAAARADLDALLAASGWKPNATKISTAGTPKMTAVEFQTRGAVDWASGTLPIEPFVRTFKRFNQVRINYILQGRFPFRSLKDYRNHYVDIAWRASGNIVDYTVTIKDRGFDRLNLPLIVQPPRKAAQQNVRTPARRSGRRIWLALPLALVAAAVAFVLVSRKTKGVQETGDGPQGTG